MTDLGLTLVRAIDERDAALKRLAVAERERDAITEKAVIETWQRIADGAWDESNPRVVRHYWRVVIGHASIECDTEAEAIAAVRKAAGLEAKP